MSTAGMLNGVMSRGLSPFMEQGVFQLAYAVPDLAEAQERLGRLYGIERFLEIKDFKLQDAKLRGEDADVRLDLALAHTGDVQIELMQLKSDVGPIPSPALLAGPHFHHIGLLVPDWDEAIASVRAAGRSLLFEGRQGDHVHCGYIDLEDEIGHVVELIYVDETGRAQLEAIREGKF